MRENGASAAAELPSPFPPLLDGLRAVKVGNVSILQRLKGEREEKASLALLRSTLCMSTCFARFYLHYEREWKGCVFPRSARARAVHAT